MRRFRRAAAALVLLACFVVHEPASADAGQIERLLEDARDADARTRVRLLERALEQLERLDEPPAGIEPETVARALARARSAPALTVDCARVGDHACLVQRAGALIEEHRIGGSWAALGREQARSDVGLATMTAEHLDRQGDHVAASKAASAIAAAEAARGRDQQAGAVIAERTAFLQGIAPSERVHRLLAFGSNLVSGGLVEAARPVFAAAEREAETQIAAVPPSDAAEAVLRMYEAQALAGRGLTEESLAVMAGIRDGPVDQGRIALASLLAKLGEPAAVRRISLNFEEDWRINQALVEAEARAGNYRSAVDLAQEAELASHRWHRLKLTAAAMAARGDDEPAAKLLAALEGAMTIRQAPDLAALWHEIDRPEEATRLRLAFLAALEESAGARLEQPVATAEEAEAIAGWTLQLARTLPAD